MFIEVKRPVLEKFPINSPFGERILQGKVVKHNGIDFKTPIGTSVFSMVNGKIFITGYEDESNKKKGLGYRIWQEFLDLKSGKIIYCWYGHLSEIFVEPGQFIEVGQPIGLTGNTGHVVPEPTEKEPNNGAHLHVQFRVKDTGIMIDAKFV